MREDESLKLKGLMMEQVNGEERANRQRKRQGMRKRE
jgi:hypothetical protein